MYEVHTELDVQRAISRVLCRFEQFLQNITQKTLIYRHDKFIVATRLQAIFEQKYDNHIDQSIHDLIVLHSLAAELMGPGGFDACIKKLLELFSDTTKRCHHISTLDYIGDIVGAGALVPLKNDLDDVITKYMKGTDKRTMMMLSKAIDMAGFGGRIIVEKTSSRPSVELINGYTFKASPMWPINIRLKFPRIICVDGFIETVSEIHHLLEEISETKESVLLFVRGMSDDVLSTLKINYDRGSLKVIPVIVRFDIEGINTMNDVAVATGSDLITSNKGDLISSIRLNLLSRISEAIVHPDKVLIVSATSRNVIDQHVKMLRNKRLEEKNDDIATLYDNRIKSLSPNHVIIRLFDDKNYIVHAQSIDYTLRAIKSLVDHGIVVINGERMLTITMIAAYVHSSRCLSELNSLGSILTHLT